MDAIFRKFARQAIVLTNWYVSRLKRAGDSEHVDEIEPLLRKLENEMDRIDRE
jgi:hypothetical protein